MYQLLYPHLINAQQCHAPCSRCQNSALHLSLHFSANLVSPKSHEPPKNTSFRNAYMLLRQIPSLSGLHLRNIFLYV